MADRHDAPSYGKPVGGAGHFHRLVSVHRLIICYLPYVLSCHVWLLTIQCILMIPHRVRTDFGVLYAAVS
jgi:hypothetical protein